MDLARKYAPTNQVFSLEFDHIQNFTGLKQVQLEIYPTVFSEPYLDQEFKDSASYR